MEKRILIILGALLCAGVLLTAVLAAVNRTPGKTPEEPAASTAANAHTETAAPTEQAAEPDWKLLLVNPWNELPEDFSVELKHFSGGHAVDARIYPDLQAMLEDARAGGLSPIVCSSYRSQEKQQALYDRKIARLQARGYSREDAEAEAGKWVAVPGTSEHQIGLAVDIVSLSYQLLDEAQADTAEQAWLMEHAHEYGFVLRYPKEKSSITGICYEPWHYRYVGKNAAKVMCEQGICLEEYLEQRRK